MAVFNEAFSRFTEEGFWFWSLVIPLEQGRENTIIWPMQRRCGFLIYVLAQWCTVDIFLFRSSRMSLRILCCNWASLKAMLERLWVRWSAFEVCRMGEMHGLFIVRRTPPPWFLILSCPLFGPPASRSGLWRAFWCIEGFPRRNSMLSSLLGKVLKD